MNAHEQATELLKKSSKPPFQIERGVLADRGQLFIVSDESGNHFKQNVARLGCAYTKDGDDAREANAELICRAVNSFEAMREALKELVKIYCPAQAGCSEATINAWINAEQALALAEGKAVQS